MAKGRKRGCPVNIRDWLIYIKNIADVNFTRIHGLTSMTYSVDSDTEEGSAATDVWAEPFITKRNGSLTLEGNPVIEASTGAEDAGQALLNDYAEMAGCDGDCTIKMVDPFGHTIIADFIVTSKERSTDDSEESVSWDLEQVGEAEVEAYTAVTSIALKDGSTAISSTLSMTVGGSAKIITVDFTPATSSNKRFRVANSNRKVATVSNITETGFTITPVGVGSTTITVTTVNGGKTATVTVSVSAGA